MSVTALPTPVPQRSDPVNFAARADAFLTALPTFGTECNALQADVNAKQTAAATSATNAATSETNAAASATAAGVSSQVVAWVSGTTYAVGNVRYSPANFRTYRRITAGAGTTDPGSDSANWLLLSFLPDGYLKVSDRKANTVDGGTAVSADITQTRTLNTVEINTITGASLASNVITLPAGTYTYKGRAPSFTGGRQRIFLYNSSDSVYTGLGNNTYNNAASSMQDSNISGQFTITANKNYTLRHYTETNAGGSGAALGLATSTGQLEVYSELEFFKVA